MLVFVGQTSALALTLTVWHLSNVMLLLKNCCCYVSVCVCPTQPVWRMIWCSACCQRCHRQHTPSESGELSHNKLLLPESKKIWFCENRSKCITLLKETGWRASVLHRGISCSVHPTQCLTVTRPKYQHYFIHNILFSVKPAGDFPSLQSFTL